MQTVIDTLKLVISPMAYSSMYHFLKINSSSTLIVCILKSVEYPCVYISTLSVLHFNSKLPILVSTFQHFVWV